MRQLLDIKRLDSCEGHNNVKHRSLVGSNHKQKSDLQFKTQNT